MYEDSWDIVEIEDTPEASTPEPVHRGRGGFRLGALLLVVALLLPMAASVDSVRGFLRDWMSGSALGAASATQHVVPIEGSVRNDFAWEVLRLTNEERRRADLPALGMHIDLVPLATLRARECQLRFSHTRPNGLKVNDSLPAGIAGVGENIAIGQRTPAEVVEGWMNSPGHRANILNPNYHSIGIGVFATVMPVNNADQLAWAQVFSSNPASTREAPPNESGIFDDVVVDTQAYPLQFQAQYVGTGGSIIPVSRGDAVAPLAADLRIFVGGADTLVALTLPKSCVSWIPSIDTDAGVSGGEDGEDVSDNPLAAAATPDWSDQPSLNAWLGSWHILTLPL